MSILNVLQELNRPVAYGKFHYEQELPYFCIMGAGQFNFPADNTYIFTENNYQIEYYFDKKDEEFESEIEQLLLANGYQYEKSEDLYIDEENLFLIYYDI